MHGVILLLVVFGLVALLLAFSRWLARRPWAAAGNVAIGLALFAIAHAYWPAVTNLRTYERLPTTNTLVAQVHCERTGPRAFRVTVTRLPDGRMQVYEMTGDEWRLEARTLIWQGRAERLGLPSSYRFERLSARYLHADRPVGEASETLPTPPTSYGLADADEIGEDVWSQARTGQRWSGQVEPGRVYGPWRPLADGARFDVWMSRPPGLPNARLDATAANEAGAKRK
jgi:hypothetical protein